MLAKLFVVLSGLSVESKTSEIIPVEYTLMTLFSWNPTAPNGRCFLLLTAYHNILTRERVTLSPYCGDQVQTNLLEVILALHAGLGPVFEVYGYEVCIAAEVALCVKPCG